jgi:hypothetical protein
MDAEKPMARKRVFVSYSHDDRLWLNRFAQHIAVLERRGLIDVWSDGRIAAGADWEEAIETALSRARVAVLLVSPAFLASEFIWRREMPKVIAHAKDGMDALPLIVRPCAWRLEEELARLQARPTDGRPLSIGSESQIDEDLSSFAYELAAKVGTSPIAAMRVNRPGIDIQSGGCPPALNGEWSGYYNRTRQIRLLVQGSQGEVFHGIMDYPAEGTATTIEGTIHPDWSKDDPIWAQITGDAQAGSAVAVSFRETAYERRGSSSISFDGEYRGIAEGNSMTGAWFSGSRVVGSFVLQHR